MEWMLNNQEGRRNLTAVDRLLAAEKLREKISEEARLKISETTKISNENRKSFSLDQVVKPENNLKSPVHTRKNLLKSQV